MDPLLFTLYINDLPILCLNCTVKLFADDAKVYRHIRVLADCAALQSLLDALRVWAAYWKLGLSVKMCFYWQVSYHDPNYFYKINSTILAPTNSIFDLGISVQSNLKPALHCTTVVSKASARYKLILESFLSRDPHILTGVYVTYVCPVLEYYTPVWSPSCKCDIDLIERVQCAFTCKLFYCCRLDPIS